MNTEKTYLGQYKKMDSIERMYLALGLELAMELAEENGGEVTATELRTILERLTDIDEALADMASFGGRFVDPNEPRDDTGKTVYLPLTEEPESHV